MAVVVTNLVCELQEAVKVRYLDGNLFSLDNQGNQINVEVLDGGDPATISGSVSANVIRSDGGTVAVSTGSISDNVVSVILPQAAYAIPGVVSIVIKLTASGVVTTIAAIVANVYQSSTDTVVDPGTIIPSIQSLISAIEAAIASIPADYSSLWASLAPAFSSSANYAAGQYVTYNGGLYRFTTAHSGTWSSSDVVAANIGGDLSDLKSALHAYTYGSRSYDIYVQGKRTVQDPGTIISTSKQVTSANTVELYAGDIISVKNLATGYRYGIGGKSGNETINSGWLSEDKDYYITKNGVYFINVSKSNDTDISVSDVTFNTTIYNRSSNANKAVNEIENLTKKTDNIIPEYSIYRIANNNVTFEAKGFLIDVNGTSSAAFAQPVTGVFTLDAGTYYFGNFTPVTDLYLQLRRMNGTTDVENILQTDTHGSFTLNESTTVRIRLGGANAKTYNHATVSIMLVKNYWPDTYIPRISAVDYPVRQNIHDMNIVIDSVFQGRDATGLTDFDDMNESGVYLLSASTLYDHSPLTTNAISHLICYKYPTSNYRIQMFFKDSDPQRIFVRRYASSGGTWSWGDWSQIYNKADLDALLSEADRTISESFTPYSISTQGNNSGIKLKVMSYNVANYNNDTATYISDSQIFEFKKCVLGSLADYLMIQEDRENIDSAETKNTMDYLYRPVFSNKIGAGGPTIYAKNTHQAAGIGYYSNGREVRYATFKISDSITLLVISTHPAAGLTEEAVAARAIQYSELFAWVSGADDSNLYSKNTTAADRTKSVARPSCTHCIIGMDGNTAFDADKTNLATYANAKNYHLGNGGFLGWFYTHFRGTNYSLDNIIVSDNIIINNIEAYSDWYGRLYSDHVPVVADVTLL